MYSLVTFGDDHRSGRRCFADSGIAESLALLLKCKCWSGGYKSAFVVETPEWVPPAGDIDAPYSHLAKFCQTHEIPIRA